MVKQVIIMRSDLNMRKGKMVAQGSHAVMAVFLKLMRDGQEFQNYVPPENDYDLTIHVKKGTAEQYWLENGFKKITVKCDSEEELLSLYHTAVEMGLNCALITDRGDTEFHGVPTNTCIAIGPNYSSEIDPLTKNLKLL
jgi:PTH2 family peptidyl-tRNA hydrolase